MMNGELKILSNWNNFPVVKASYQSPYFREDITESMVQATEIIARGNGRCYGDASLGNNVINMLKYNNILRFDKELGVIACQSGVLLSDILELIVPNGWFLPVTPGTQFITIGGALASDVHGKNHHKEGSFADFVEEFLLLKPDGSIAHCSKASNVELFWYTMGGMGLTGIILENNFYVEKNFQSVYKGKANQSFESFRNFGIV